MNSNSGAYHSALEDLVPDSDHTDSSILYYGQKFTLKITFMQFFCSLKKLIN